MAAALAAGASAVRVGTRLVGATEADAHPVYQHALIKSEAEDTVHITGEGFSNGWPNAPHRVIRSSLEAARAFQGEQVGERLLKSEDQWVPVMKLEPIAISKNVKGHVEAMSMWAGEGVGSVKKIVAAEDIVRELNDDAEKLLRRWSLSNKPRA
jgi:nitronate monooxygenase